MRLDETDGNEGSFLVRFHGVRGSHPVPGAAAASIGGNTSCIEVVSGDACLVLDCGSGLVTLGDRMQAETRAGAPSPRVLVLVSHLHHDHTMGFPFFKPVYDAKAVLHLVGPSHAGLGFRELFESAFADPYFPVPASAMASRRTFTTAEDGDVLTWRSADEPPVARPAATEVDPETLVVRVFRNLAHPNGGVLNFRIERGGRSIVMATDVEGTQGTNGDLVEFAKGADLLIHDAQYTDEEYEGLTKGWGHSTWRMAVDVARRAQVRRLVLYHHDPAHDDAAVEAIERQARSRFPRAIAACEGLEIRV